MKCFFDTSALVKLFREEIGSDAEHDWFFVCSDTTLLKIAEQCVPNVINPIGRFRP